MTLIAGIGFLDEAYLISDSRVTYSRNNASEDRLMKVYQITPRIMIAFASEHVDFTLEVLRRITEFSLKNLNSKKGRFILPYLIRLAKHEYFNVIEEENIKKYPRMEFLYCGVINKQQMFSSNLFYEIIKRKGGSMQVPEKIGRAMMRKDNGVWALEPPCPILCRQSFPDSNQSPYINLGYITGGSGRNIINELDQSYYELFDWDLGNTKGIILENIIDDYIKKNNIPSVGGIVQVWRINKDGITPICYVQKQTNTDGEDVTLKELRFLGNKWVLVNFESNTKSEARSVVRYFTQKKTKDLKIFSYSNY